jgi:hypothetical protein
MYPFLYPFLYPFFGPLVNNGILVIFYLSDVFLDTLGNTLLGL